MVKYIFSAILVTLLVFMASCEKDKNMRTATIIQTDDISYEGCGYIIKMDTDGELLKPVHLPGAFQHDNIRVELSYNHTGNIDTCKYGTVLYDVVQIDDIELIR